MDPAAHYRIHRFDLACPFCRCDMGLVGIDTWSCCHCIPAVISINQADFVCESCGERFLLKSKEKYMSEQNKKRSTKNKKKEDGKFRSKNIKHDPVSESARAVFGLQGPEVKTDELR